MSIHDSNQERCQPRAGGAGGESWWAKSVFENSSGRLFLILFLVLDFLRKRKRKRKRMTTAPEFFKHALSLSSAGRLPENRRAGARTFRSAAMPEVRLNHGNTLSSRQAPGLLRTGKSARRLCQPEGDLTNQGSCAFLLEPGEMRNTNAVGPGAKSGTAMGGCAQMLCCGLQPSS
jgi:hypothetical protein